ncbi:glycosyl hydrolase [Nocardioides lianchengensis]|nr:glycosyl hydrolase [Nocardioides lianchengensis]NYG11733.1 hypothetical protein [Nocardioides lianchengensis]
MADRPMYRFWNGGGLMTPESIQQQVSQMKEAGAGGFEANFLVGEVTAGGKMPGYVPAQHGFGTSEFTRAWTQLFEEGRKQGMLVDHLYTPGWSAGIQGLSPDEPGTAKELVYGSVYLDAGQSFSGAVPTRALPGGVTKRVLEGVVAYRCETNCAGTGVPTLDPDSAVDLTATVSGTNLAYTAPAASGRYVIVAAWSQGTGQTIRLADTATPSFMVDHYGAAGARAIIDYWEENILDPDLRAAMRASGGSLFFDSLEINRYGQEVRHWTDDFLDEFRERRGYSLRPYIATLSTADHLTLASKPLFEFSGGVGKRVREDYLQTLGELFNENHIGLLKDWAATYDMTIRGQAYVDWGPGAINRTDAAIALDIPEQEANNRTDAERPLFSVEESDAWRQISSAKSQVGGNRISYEAGTFGRADGLARASLVARINSQFALGMNEVIYHGWPDQSPGASNQWPGFFPFAKQAPENYGIQVPMFEDDKTINTYVGRMQNVLRRGTLANDVAVYWDGIGRSTYDDDGLSNAGYTYGFMNSTLVTDPSASLDDGRLTKLGYRALVIDGTSTSAPLDLAAAKRILGWARSGFPIVVVGDLAPRVRGYRPGQDGAIQKVLNDLLAENSVTTVPSHTRVPRALARAGVTASASYDAPLVTLHRKAANSDYYYLFNEDTKQTATTVTLQGDGQPYRYDAWSGSVTPIAEYTRTPSGVQIEVDLATGTGELVAMTRGNEDTPAKACAVNVTRTSADEVRAEADALTVRADAAGSYVSTLSDGSSVTTSIPSVGAPIRPSTWKLAVTSWTGGPGGPNDTLKTPLAARDVTTKTDGTLPSWQEIAGLEKVSGTATYTTTIDTGAGWTGGAGAHLDLGTVLGTAQVTVNGQRLDPVDQVTQHRVDLGDHLKAGTNQVVIHIATPVYNAGLDSSDAYGLVGPVIVQPYGAAKLTTACDTFTPPTQPPAAQPKQASKVKLKVNAHVQVRGASRRIRATTTVTARQDMSGKVVFRIAGRKVTRTLNAKNTATFRLPKGLKVGRHALRVHYLGDRSTKPAKSRKIWIRVSKR